MAIKPKTPNINYSDIQRDATRDARSDGELVALVVHVLQQQNDEATRQDILMAVPSYLASYGFSNKKILGATHVPVSGSTTNRNYLISAIDFTLTDMKNGKYGDDAIIELDGTEQQGTWNLVNSSSCNIDAIRQVASRQLRHSEHKDRVKAAVVELIDWMKGQDIKVKQAIITVGRGTVAEYAVVHKLAVANAADELLAALAELTGINPFSTTTKFDRKPFVLPINVVGEVAKLLGLNTKSHYDSGAISANSKGKMVWSSKIDPQDDLGFNKQAIAGGIIPGIGGVPVDRLEYHLKNVFKR